MSHARILRRIPKPAVEVVKGLGVGTYVVTGAIAVKGSVVAKQALLTTIMPGFAIAKGFLDLIEGVDFAINPQGVDPEDMRLGATSELPKIYELEYSNKERYLRGGLKALSGMFLLEGGIEACLGKDLLGLTGVGVGLLWRIAISSLVDLVLALHDLVKVGFDTGYTQAHKERNKKVYFELINKACTAAGWTMLAILGPMNPVGLVLLGIGAVSVLLNQAVAKGGFLSSGQNSLNLSDHTAERQRQEGRRAAGLTSR